MSTHRRPFTDARWRREWKRIRRKFAGEEWTCTCHQNGGVIAPGAVVCGRVLESLHWKLHTHNGVRRRPQALMEAEASK